MRGVQDVNMTSHKPFESEDLNEAFAHLSAHLISVQDCTLSTRCLAAVSSFIRLVLSCTFGQICL